MEKERERNINAQGKHGADASYAPPSGDLAHNPGMCPDQELNQGHFSLQASAQSTEQQHWSWLSANFLIGLLVSLLLSCMCSLYILLINPLSDAWFANIFSHPIVCLFILLVISFTVQLFSICCSLTCLFFFSFLFVL